MPRHAKAWKFNRPLWQNEEHFRTENFYKLCLAAVLTHESRIAEELVVSLFEFWCPHMKTEKIFRLASNSKSSLTTHNVCFRPYNFVSSKVTSDGKFSD